MLFAEFFLFVWLCSGHGSFSNNKRLNNLIGHLTHSTILVPYNGWWEYIHLSLLCCLFTVLEFDMPDIIVHWTHRLNWMVSYVLNIGYLPLETGADHWTSLLLKVATSSIFFTIFRREDACGLISDLQKGANSSLAEMRIFDGYIG
jgi:hypothetical protein